MKDKFQMSSMRELTFFLGLQVKQKKDGIFISQDKYVAEILRKFRLTEGKSASTPIDTEKPLLKDPDGEAVDVHTYRSMIGSLMYLTSSRPEIMFAVCACVHFQVTPKASHLYAVKRIFRYLKEGVDCLPNEEIFAELARIGYKKPSTKLTFYKAFFSSQWKFLIHTILQSMSAKRTSWNEFSSAIASAVICLSTGVIEEEGAAKKQVPDVVVDNVAAQGANTTVQKDDVHEPSIPSLTPPTLPLQQSQDLPSTSHEVLDACTALTRRVKHLEYDKVAQALEIIKLKRRRIDTSADTVMDDASNQGRMIDDLDKDDVVALMDDKEEEKKEEEVKDDQVQGRQAKIYKINMASKVLSMQEDDPAEVQEVVDVVTTAKLIIEVVTIASEIVTATSITISTAEPQVLDAAITTAALVRVAAAPTRRRKGVVIMDPKEESTTIIPVDTKSKDKGKGIMDVAIKHVKQKAKEDPVVQRYQVMKKRPQTEAQAQKNMIMYLKNVTGFRLDYFKGMSYDDIRPIFEAKFNSNIEFLLKTKEQLEEEENRAIQSINETSAQKAAKRRKLNEEVEDLKRHLEIVPDEDDDVYIEATPLARKVPVVDYEIIHLNNKPHYKIIRADGTHQLYVSFLTLLKNFDREDLESLWSLVKERFSTSKPNNFSDDFLLTTLGAMFERPDGQAQVWKNQRTIHGQAKLILLVERRYPLSRFTFDQMLNAVRLRVEKQSKMSLELLRKTLSVNAAGEELSAAKQNCCCCISAAEERINAVESS
nr:hypothetical protein [Tanacetum cinerariifolium]